MAFIAIGAAALGFAGLSMYVSPGQKEAEEMAQSFFGKSLAACTPVEKKTIDMAAGIPKLEGMRDGFQSLFPRPKPRKDKQAANAARSGSSRGSRQQAADPQSGMRPAPSVPEDYALYDDPDVEAIYPVHEDTADPDQRYLAHASDLKNLVPFDIETESLEDAGTYDVEDFLKTNDRLPQTLTLPRQLGGAATSANLLINKLTRGGRAGLPQDYVLPGHAPQDEVHPPTDHELEQPPEEATRSLRAAVDYQLGAGKYQRGLPDGVARLLAQRALEEAQRAGSEEYSDDDEDESSDYEDDDESDDDESDEEAAPSVVARGAAAQGGRAAAAAAVEEFSDEDEEESD